jgi:membrane-associated protease RseP (regulator of RpoE activity)
MTQAHDDAAAASEGFDEDDPEVASAPPSKPTSVGVHILLFALTTVTVFYAGAAYAGALPETPGFLSILTALPKGYAYALPLLAILLTHEFGHYFAARLHAVRASLPYFIPMPMVSPFGTMGAIISMPDRIRSRNALLDIGAAGPLAGLVVALPVWCVGIATSKVQPLDASYIQEGQSLLYWALKRVIAGPIPDGSDLSMSSVAFAGWTGALVTMLNLVPVGQLDGGHIAYSLFGEKQDRYAKWLHVGLLVPLAYNLVRFVGPVVVNRTDGIGTAISNSSFWLVWFTLILVMRRMSGINHPPVDRSTLSGGRRVVAFVSLALFVLLFQPTPWARYG